MSIIKVIKRLWQSYALYVDENIVYVGIHLFCLFIPSTCKSLLKVSSMTTFLEVIAKFLQRAQQLLFSLVGEKSY